MKCYLINLDRSPDRLAFMATQIKEIGFQLHRISAVDGRRLTAEALSELIPAERLWKAPITPTEVGCFLSHKKCLEAIADGQDQYGLILEDDVSFSKRAISLLQETSWIPAGTDIIKLETQCKKILLGELIPCVGTQFSLRKLKSTHILAAAYIVSKDGAKRILEEMSEVTAPVDHFLFNREYGILNKLSVYQCIPAICSQAGLESTLQEQRQSIYQNPTFYKRILREIKRLFVRSWLGGRGVFFNLMSDSKWVKVYRDE